jgi:peroxiredoxin
MRIFAALLMLFLLWFPAPAQDAKSAGKNEKLAPSFSVTSLEGKTFKLEDLKGKVVVLNFWFTTCPPCKEEIPKLNKIVEENKNRDVVFLGLAMDNAQKIQSFIKKNPFKYHLVPQGVQALFGDYAEKEKNGSMEIPFPTHIVINQEGEIEMRVKGIKGVEATRKTLDKLFGEDKKPAAEKSL